MDRAAIPPATPFPAGSPQNPGGLKIARRQIKSDLPIKPLAFPLLVGARECALYVGAKREESYQ